MSGLHPRFREELISVERTIDGEPIVVVRLKEQSATDLAQCFPSDDGFSRDMWAAIDEAWPPEQETTR